MSNFNDALFRPQCIITGCYLVHRHRVLYGDLHAFQQTWIFNAILASDGEAEEIEETPTDARRTLKVSNDFEIFERRGVVVVPFLGSLLNKAAAVYIGDAAHVGGAA